MKLDDDKMVLYAVTDRAWVGESTLAFQVEQAIIGGATFVQLREKDLPYDEFLKQANEVKKITDRYGVPFVINDNIEVALACGADGVHVGQKDLEASRVREIVGKDKILGVSAQTLEQAVLAEKSGADYLGVGAIFYTPTKPEAELTSLETLKEICKNVSIPVVAIGGITKNNIMQLSDTGVKGVALVSAIFAQKDIKATCQELYRLTKMMLERPDTTLPTK